MRVLEIKRVEEKPLAIHTKEKAKIHAKVRQETKMKGRNILTVTKVPKIAGQGGTMAGPGKKGADIAGTLRKGKARQGRKGIGKESIRRETEGEGLLGWQHRKQENSKKAPTGAPGHIQTKLESHRHSGKNRPDILRVAGAAGAKTAAGQIDGGKELYDSYMAMDTFLARPAGSAARLGRDLYCRQSAQRAEQRIKKVQAGSKVRKRGAPSVAGGQLGKAEGGWGKTSPKRAAGEAAKKTAAGTAGKGAKGASKEAAKETARSAVKGTAAAAGAAAGTAATGIGGILAGMAAGEAVGRELDRRDLKNSTRSRMVQLFVAKMRQEDNKDSIAKALKDTVRHRFSIAVKHAVRYTALFFAGAFLVMALMALPVITVLAVTYNSPLAIFFPSISSAETTQEVLSAYVAGFDKEVELEMLKTAGYDRCEKVYVGFQGEGTPDNYCDILAVYMVKHGNGDTATDMTDKAKQNLKKVFDDMCSYEVSAKVEEETDDEGDTTSYTVKYVEITLKTYQDMIPIYGFNAEEQEMLAEIMKPENLALLGYEGPSGGQGIEPGQYQAVVDSIPGASGKKVLEYALSKVGYPYSQALRDSGTHFDCSSLAYYAWRHAGVNISYNGSTTAASEGQLCHDNGWLVGYGEMQPGDLVFYSYGKNGRFKDISHVAVYAGNGMVVEAANARLGVVYRPVHSRSSIVMVGRPR